MSTLALGPTQQVRWSELAMDHSPPTRAEVKHEWSKISSPTLCLRGTKRDNSGTVAVSRVLAYLFHQGPVLQFSIVPSRSTGIIMQVTLRSAHSLCSSSCSIACHAALQTII